MMIVTKVNEQLGWLMEPHGVCKCDDDGKICFLEISSRVSELPIHFEIVDAKYIAPDGQFDRDPTRKEKYSTKG
jgi:hypothetical protein